MAQTIKLKRSSVAGNIPSTSDLALGEVAINTADGKMYIKKSVDGTDSIIDLSDSPQDAILQEYQFTASANQTTFSGADDNNDTLYYTAGAVQIFLNGILLDSGVDYTATSNTSVVLAETVDANDYLQVFAFKQKISGGSVTVNTFTGNGSTTAFTLSVNPGDENNTRVFIDGVYQSKSNYSVSATTLTFTTAPPTGTAIEVESGNRDVALDTATNLDFPDNVKMRLGTGQDLQMYSDGTYSYIEERNTTSGLKITSDNQVAIRKHDNENIALFNVDGAVHLYHDNAQKFSTTSTGINVTGNIANTSGDFTLDVAGDIILDSDGGLIEFKNGGTRFGRFTHANSNLELQSMENSGDILLRGKDSGGNNVTALTLDMSDVGTAHFNGHIRLGDNRTASFGAGYDIEITSDGTNGTIGAPNGDFTLDVAGTIKLDADNSGTIYLQDAGNIYGIIEKAGSDLRFRSGGQDADIVFMGNDGGSLITALTLDMSDAGHASFNNHITAAGNIYTAGNVNLTVDGKKIRLGAGEDLQLYHDGSHSYVVNTYASGALKLKSDDFRVENTASRNQLKTGVSGAVQLFYDTGSATSVKLATTSGGVAVTGSVTANSGGGSAILGSHLDLGDNQKARFGASDDLQIYHDGSNSYATSGTGQFFLTSSNSNIWLQGGEGGILSADGSEYLIRATSNGPVKLFYNNVKKFETSSTGVTVTGNIANTSGDLTLDVAGNIVLDADGGGVYFKDAGVNIGFLQNSGANDFRLVAGQQDKDIVFMGNDGGSSITALSLDMSNAGRAFFNVGASFSGDVAMADNNKTKYGQGEDLIVYSDGTNGEIEAPNGNLTLDVAGDITLDADGGDIRFKDGGTHIGSLYNSSNNFAIYSAVNNADLLLQGQDGGSTITALTLDMSAAGAATFNSTVTSTGLTATGANTSAATYATFQRSDTAVSARIRYDGSTTTFFGTSTNHPLAFETNGTEAMRIDSSGNVGLGVTPNANWSSSYRAIDAFGGATFQFEANSTRQGQNFYGYPWKYKATRTATSIAHTAGGDISFQVAPSGTADSAITWSQAMLIKNSGKVGIGTSSPNLKLHVEENADAWVGEFKNVRSAGGYGLRVDMTAGASATDTRFALGVYTPGNTGLFVKNNGNVGIGLTNQAHLLDILKTGSGDATINIKSTTGGDPNIIFNSAAANRSGLLKFQDNGTNVGRIEYVHNGDRIDFQAGSATGATMSVVNGKLLVGSTTTDASSSEKFLVKSTGGQHSRFVNSSDTYSTVYIKNTSTTANTNQPFLTFQDTGGNRGNFGLRYSTAQLVIQGHGGVGIAAGTGGISQDPDLFVNSIGNVGIGTSSPVNNGTNSQGLTINGTGNYQNLALQHNGTTQFLMYLNGSSGTFLNQVTADPIMFLTSDTERMRILAGGNVGIGTNNPSYLVHAQNSTATGQSVVATSGNGQFIMAIGSQNSPGVAQEAFVGTLSDTRFKIKVNNTVKGSWTDNGLAIGTQSSAYTNLDVAGQIAMSIGNAHAVFSSDTSGKIFIKANENCVNAATAIHMQMPIISGSGSLEDKLVINHSDITAYEHFLPSSDNTYDLGTATKRWRNIYTGDLHLSNESQKKGNDVDGTKGNWTVQEGEENLYLINNKTGKKYKFALEEIE